MKLLFGALIVLLAAVSLAVVVFHDPGYVLIAYRHWTAETTLSMFIVLLLLAFLAVYFLIRFIVGLRRLPRSLQLRRQQRRALKARLSLTRGLIALAEGRWSEAEKTVLRHAEYSETPLLNYLAAARAAQQQGAHERRDQYLHQAHAGMSAADVAVGLTQAELQIAHRQFEQALATLTHLRTLAPRHAYVLRLLMKLYRKLNDWEHLRDLLPELRKRKAVESDELDRVARQVYTELLTKAARESGAVALQDVWRSMPRVYKDDLILIQEYVRHLIPAGAAEEAEALTRNALKKTWSDELAYGYGLIEAADPVKQLATAEVWLRMQGKNPVLLLTLGRLSKRCRLWGKARTYLEASLGAGARADAYQELGGLLERLGQHEDAVECYRKGIALAVGEKTSAAAPSEPALSRVGVVTAAAVPALSSKPAAGS